MTEFGIAVGLVLVIEGALYALFPGAMKSMMSVMMTKEDKSLSAMGLVAAVLGFGLVWLSAG